MAFMTCRATRHSMLRGLCVSSVAVVGLSPLAVAGADNLYVNGLLHEPLGQAEIFGQDIDGNGGFDLLTISNIGSSGNDGARIDLWDVPAGEGGGSGLAPQGWSGRINFGAPGNVPRGMHLTVTASDQFDNPLPAFVIEETNGGDAAVTLADACQACAFRLVVRSGGNIVVDVDLDGASDIVVTGSIGGDNSKDDDNVSGFHWRQLSGPFTPLRPKTTITEKALILPQPTPLTFEGVPDVDAVDEVDEVFLIITSQSDESDPTVASIHITAANTAGNDVALSHEAVYAGDFQVRALGAAHIVGTCVKDDGECGNALQFSNLTLSGDDGALFTNSILTHKPPEPSASSNFGQTVNINPIVPTNDTTLTVSGDLTVEGASEDAGSDATATLRSGAAVTGGANGPQVDFTADFVGSDFIIDQNVITILLNGQPVATSAPATFDGASSLATAMLPGDGSGNINQAAIAFNTGGQHVPGIVWHFAGGVPVTIADDPTEYTADELRFISGQPVIVDSDKGLNLTYQNAPGQAPAQIHITEAAPAYVENTEGYFFGLMHTSLGDSAFGVEEEGVKVVGPGSGPGTDGGVQIDTGAADFLDLDTLMVLSQDGAGLAATARGMIGGTISDLYDVTVQHNAADSPNKPVEISASFADSGAPLQTISLFHNGELTAEFVDQSNGTPLFAQSEPTTYTFFAATNTGLAGADQGTAHSFVWDSAQDLSVGGQNMVADTLLVSAQSPTVFAPLADVQLLMQGALNEFTITGESLGAFGLTHEASDAARFDLARDSDGDGLREFVLLNPSNGGPATIASTSLPTTATQNLVFEVGISVPDPCDGVPPPCESWPANTHMRSHGSYLFVSGGSEPGSAQVTLDGRPSQDPEGDAVVLDPDFTELNADAYDVEVIQDGEIVTTIVNYADAVEVNCSDNCGNNENWPFTIEWSMTANGSKCICRADFSGQRIFSFEIPVEAAEGDALRFISNSTIGELEQIAEHELTTVHIPQLIVTDMNIQQSQPNPCPADLDGSDSVDVADLLALLSAWGPCADCAQDLDNSGSVDVADLLQLLGTWGMCP